MSRSKPNIKNPASRFFQWRGGAVAIKGADGKTTYEGGKINYYDKASEETIDIALPFSFLVLDELNTVSGYSEPKKSSFWSNEVRNITRDILTVKTSSGTEGSGTWKGLEYLKSRGAKYAKSVYIAYRDESGEFAIGNIKIMGAALTSWIEFQKKYDVQQCAVKITNAPKLDKKGSTHYFTPVFEALEVSPESDAEAKMLDVELQNYLSIYFSSIPEVEQEYATEASELNEPTPDEPADDGENGTAPEQPADVEEDTNTVPVKKMPF